MGKSEEHFEQLKALAGSKSVIVGIGNTLKGDDGVGPFICEKLAGKTCAKVIDAATVPENYIQRIISQKPQNLIIIDAVDFGGKAGEIKVFSSEKLNSVVISTHTLSPKIFIDMICREINADVYFIGVQPAHVQLGEPISRQVQGAIEKLTDILIETFPLKK